MDDTLSHELLTVDQFSEVLQVDASTTRRWVNDNIIPTVRIAGTVRIPQHAIPRAKYAREYESMVEEGA